MKSTPSDFSSDWSLQSVPQCIFNDTLFEVFDDKNTLIGALQNATLTIEQANYVFDESKKYYSIGDCFDIIRSCDVDLGNKPDLVCMLLNTLCDTLQFDLFKKIGHIIQDLENMLIACHPKLSRKNSLNLASIIDKSRQNAENTEYARNPSKLNKQISNLHKLGSRTEIDEKNAFVLMEDEGSIKVERVNPPKSNSSVKTTVQKGNPSNSTNIDKLSKIEIKNGYRTFYDVYEILQNAYKENDENAINYAIDNNYTNILNDAEENLLHQIARRGDTEFLKYMHKKGMDITLFFIVSVKQILELRLKELSTQ